MTFLIRLKKRFNQWKEKDQDIFLRGIIDSKRKFQDWLSLFDEFNDYLHMLYFAGRSAKRSNLILAIIFIVGSIINFRRYDVFLTLISGQLPPQSIFEYFLTNFLILLIPLGVIFTNIYLLRTVPQINPFLFFIIKDKDSPASLAQAFPDKENSMLNGQFQSSSLYDLMMDLKAAGLEDQTEVSLKIAPNNTGLTQDILSLSWKTAHAELAISVMPNKKNEEAALQQRIHISINAQDSDLLEKLAQSSEFKSLSLEKRSHSLVIEYPGQTKQFISQEAFQQGRIDLLKVCLKNI